MNQIQDKYDIFGYVVFLVESQFASYRANHDFMIKRVLISSSGETCIECPKMKY